jgi:hypothetical protein
MGRGEGQHPGTAYERETWGQVAIETRWRAATRSASEAISQPPLARQGGYLGCYTCSSIFTETRTGKMGLADRIRVPEATSPARTLMAITHY